MKKETKAVQMGQGMWIDFACRRQNVIDCLGTRCYSVSQSFRQEKRRFDKKVIGKTENDRQIRK